MMEKYCPDQTDLDILKLLQKDGRRTYKELSYYLKKGKSTIQERVKQLEHAGYIASSVASVDPNKFESCITTYLQVQLNSHSVHALQQFQQDVGKFSEVLECRIPQVALFLC